MKLTIKPSECDCERCSSMCQAPCCGTPADMKALMDAGYGKRVMFDNLPGGNDMLKPALKGHEGKIAPWEVHSIKGCTFWKKGKCELHSLGLKPTQGKLAHHSLSREQSNKIGDYLDDSWNGDKGAEAIKQWKEIND